jgi:hypothetical protein
LIIIVLIFNVSLNGDFPDDIYSIANPLKYYGEGNPYDQQSLNLIRLYHNKPTAQVKIYRAVPKIITNQEKIDDYQKQMKYILKYGKIPAGVTNWSNKSDYYDFLSDEIEKLKQLPTDDHVKINNGDWVTINPYYAKEHGVNNLRNKYRILSKIVPAKHVFTNGDSINEWGYDASA